MTFPPKFLRHSQTRNILAKSLLGAHLPLPTAVDIIIEWPPQGAQHGGCGEGPRGPRPPRQVLGRQVQGVPHTATRGKLRYTSHTYVGR